METSTDSATTRSANSPNQARNQQHEQHRRQEISSDSLPAFPFCSSQDSCLPSSRLCAGRPTRTGTRTPTTATTTRTTTKAVLALTSPNTKCKLNGVSTHKYKSHKAAVPTPFSFRLRSRPCWGSAVPVVLLQLILVLSTLVLNDAAAADRDMMQWSIGEFKLDLVPTPEPLTNVDNVIAPSIERVVRSAMQHQFAGSFLYMYVASLGHVELQQPTGRQAGQDQSMTAVYYNGGVVAFETPPSNIDINAIVKASIEANLTNELATYGEPWSWIQSVTFTGSTDEAPPAPGSGPVATTSTLRPTPAPTSAPSTSPTFLATPPPNGGISAIEGDENGDKTNTSQSDSKATAPQIVASGFGIAFVMIGATLFIKATRNRRTHAREVALSLEEADSEASVRGGEEGGAGSKDQANDPTTTAALAAPSTDAQDGGNSRPASTKSRGSRRALRQRGMGEGGSGTYIFEDNTDDEDRSEMAQYSTGEWMESTSVAQSVTSSDFTLTTLDDATYSALADSSIGRQNSPRTSPSSTTHPDTSSRVAVMGFASSETFERDRLVTLHKDMLQSEWGTPLATHGHITYATNTSGSTIVRPTGPATSMSFEEAYQGDADEPRKEVVLLPPPPTSHARREK